MEDKNVIRVPAEPQNNLRTRVFIAQDQNDPNLVQARLVVGYSQRDDCTGDAKRIKSFLADLQNDGVISEEDSASAMKSVRKLLR